MEKRLTVEWTEKSLLALQSIYDYYATKSFEVAERIINDIIETAESIKYPEQYEKDEILPKYRRMIAWHYKILYKTEGNMIYILTVFDTRQNPLKISEGEEES